MISFLKYTRLYFLISTIVIVVGLFSLFRFGFNLSIDFTGGTLLEYKINKTVSRDTVQQILKKQDIKNADVSIDTKQVVHIKTDAISETKEVALRNAIKKQLNVDVKVQRLETVGPVIGQETIRKTLIASLIAIVGILLYVTFAFKKVYYGVSAVVAMIHDLVVLIGIYSLISHFFGAQVDTLFVTALLTTLSFSVHDTIVVFDKIREYQKTTTLPFATNANKALTETMVRSINNSLTIALMLVPLALFGGETIKFFATALLIGTITGTYSSPFIATPLLAYLHTRKNNRS